MTITTLLVLFLAPFAVSFSAFVSVVAWRFFRGRQRRRRRIAERLAHIRQRANTV